MSTHTFSVHYLFSFICFSSDDCAKTFVLYAVLYAFNNLKYYFKQDGYLTYFIPQKGYT